MLWHHNTGAILTLTHSTPYYECLKEWNSTWDTMKWLTLNSSLSCCMGRSFSTEPSLYEARLLALMSSLSTSAAL
jgi:hypothetical protein